MRTENLKLIYKLPQKSSKASYQHSTRKKVVSLFELVKTKKLTRNGKGRAYLFLSTNAYLLNFLVVSAVVVVIVIAVDNFVLATVSLLNSSNLQKPHDFRQKACINSFEIVQWLFCTSIKQSDRSSTHG